MTQSTTASLAFMSCFVLSCFVLTSIAKGDFYTYRYTGELPNGSSSHSQVADGESFVATFIVDTSIADAAGSADQGLYIDSVVSGQVIFSGGYESNIDFSGGGILVLDGGNDIDAVFLQSLNSTPFNATLMAASDDLDTLNSDQLPAPGTMFSSSANVESTNIQLVYNDAFGSIDYRIGDEANVVFAATIPEPSSFVIVFGSLAGIVLRRGAIIGTGCP